MVKPLARKWSVVVLRGILAILFTLAAFVWPDTTIVVLIWILGVLLIALGFRLRNRSESVDRQTFHSV